MPLPQDAAAAYTREETIRRTAEALNLPLDLVRRGTHPDGVPITAATWPAQINEGDTVVHHVEFMAQPAPYVNRHVYTYNHPQGDQPDQPDFMDAEPDIEAPQFPRVQAARGGWRYEAGIDDEAAIFGIDAYQPTTTREWDAETYLAELREQDPDIPLVGVYEKFLTSPWAANCISTDKATRLVDLLVAYEGSAP